MNAIAIAVTAAVVAGSAAFAHGSRPAPPQKRAGTLTCTTRATAGLVFGLTPVADCTFVASRGGFRQSYVALFSPAHRVRDTSVPETIRWDVITKDGFSRPGMLGGAFDTLTDRPEISRLSGATASRAGPSP